MTVALVNEGPVAWLRMDRPEALNAFGAQMVTRMPEQVALVAADPAIHAVVLTGNGRSFSTGVDVKALDAETIGIEWFRDWLAMTTELNRITVPVVAAVQGHCLGGGLMLTLAADYRIAADDLRIGLGAVRRRILPGCAPHRLAAVVGTIPAAPVPVRGVRGRRRGHPTRTRRPRRRARRARVDSGRRPSALAGLSSLAVRELKQLLRQAPSLDEDAYASAYLAAQARCLAERSR